MFKHAIFIAWFMILLTACNLTQTEQSSNTVTSPPTESHIVVAWVDAGNLVVWQQGEDMSRRIASGGVVRPFLSPDGERIVFTRGPGGIPETLWVVDTSGTAEQQLVGDGKPNGFRSGQSRVGDVDWLNDTILYFNTMRRTALGVDPRNDLYRANTRTREVALILPPGEGGRFSFSPDGEQIAVVTPGTYGRQDAAIRVVDPLALDDPRRMLFFVGVATGAEFPFYPRLQWLPDSSALLVAIPDSDLIYADTEDTDLVPPTRLWHLPVDTPGDRALLGSVRASFFGLPRWSSDGTQMSYLRRTPGTNEFTLVLADESGENPSDYLVGQAGSLDSPQWISGSDRFVYTLGSTGTVYIGGADTEPKRLSEELIFAPQFVSDDLYVFATTPAVAADGIQMRYAHIGETSQAIGSAGATIPIFDAVLVPDKIAQ